MAETLDRNPAGPGDDPKLSDEAGRLAALHRYDVLDTRPEEPFEKLTALVRTVLGVPISTISLIDARRQWLKSVLGAVPVETPRETSICTHTIRTRTPLVITDTLIDERFAQNPSVTGPPSIRSYLGVPLQTPDGYNIGAICAIDIVPRQFSQHQIDMLQSFAAIVVDELELRNLARLDHLTGAVSRRTFFEEAGQTIGRFKRYGHPASVIMFDIDHFKRINDGYGHPAGDAVLRGIGMACAELIRECDSFGRLGGEEFAILLPDTAAANALAAAERFRNALSKMVVPDYPDLRVTASFGVATLTPDWSAEQWIAAADQALYAAKHNGRNQCRMAVIA